MIFTKNKKLMPELSKPTKEEIEKTQRTIMVQYNIELSDKKASIFASLVKELNWWVGLKDDKILQATVIDELVIECREIYRKKHKKELSDLEATDCAEALLDETSKKEKQRIKDEMTAIIRSTDVN